jgi:hypothetical protein
MGTGRKGNAGFLWALVCLAVVLIFTLAFPALNLVMAYARPGGSFLEKFHPATWLLVPLALVLWTSPSRASGLKPRHLRWALAVFVLLFLWLATHGKGALASSFLDVHITPVVLVLALSRMSYEHTRSLLRVFVAIAAVNVLLVVVEFTLQTALVPREDFEQYFRPAGLLGHPIVAGTVFYCAMFVLSRGVVPRWLTRPAMVFFLVGIAMCGVRGPLAAGVAIFLLHIIWPSSPRMSVDDYVIDFGFLALLPLACVLALTTGALDRVLEIGLWDKSAQSRFYIFDAFEFVGRREFWHGYDGYDDIAYLATQTTGGPLVENAFASTALQAGFPSAATLAVALLILHGPAIRRSVVFGGMFVVVAMTTSGFGSKNMIPAAMTLCGYWVWRQATERQSAVNHGAPRVRARVN